MNISPMALDVQLIVCVLVLTSMYSSHAFVVPRAPRTSTSTEFSAGRRFTVSARKTNPRFILSLEAFRASTPGTEGVSCRAFQVPPPHPDN